ncbi:F-box/LRR-repeat protein 8-like [Latimeria chalumnae]|uniref:F-box/LRR-repeat protein 8-like n=1 Tax=Latimeria chalumnae TaxID=7897 RepID=UPI00313C1205
MDEDTGERKNRQWRKPPGTQSLPRYNNVEWEYLPHQLLLNIFSLLDLADRSAASLTCKKWLKVFYSAELWENVTLRVQAGSNKTWIALLSRYGPFVRCVKIIADLEERASRMWACIIIDHLAHVNTGLQKLTVVTREDDSGAYFEDVQKSLRGLFNSTCPDSAGLTTVDFTRLSGQFEDPLFLCLARSHSSLEKLLIANRYPGIQLQPKSLLSVVKTCRRLSHLAVWSSTLTDEVMEAFLETLRAPLQSLEIHCSTPTEGSSVISNSTWKNLKAHLPNLEVHLHFPVDVSSYEMLAFLQKDIPVASLDIHSCFDLSEVLMVVGENYKRCLKKIRVFAPKSPATENTRKTILETCSKVTEANCVFYQTVSP